MCSEDMFRRTHLPILREEIDTLASDKCGLKLNLNAIILCVIKSLKGMSAERMDKCHELVNFSDAYHLHVYLWRPKNKDRTIDW